MIVRQNERGKIIAEFPDHRLALDYLAAVGAAPDETRCLRFLDAYGDTVFNRLQLPVLVSELRQHVAPLSEEMRRRVERLEAFIQPAIDEPHLYVRFMGD
jgi:hypothetical protein